MSDVMLRRARPEDAGDLYGILLECAAWLRERGVAQWESPYPRARYEEDIARDRVHACEADGRVIGTVTVHETPPDYYSPSAWSPAAARYFSQLAIRRTEKGKGFGRRVIEAIEREARTSAAIELRIDIVPTNSFLRTYYESLGFHAAGDSNIKGGTVLLMAKNLVAR